MKQFYRYIIILFVCLISTAAYAQTNLRSLGTMTERSGKPNLSKTEGNTAGADPAVVKEDTVYSFHTLKRHGWFEPLGLLTKEQVKHRNYSIMFTGKKENGHWTKMEFVNAYGKHVPGKFTPYIAKIGSVKDSMVNNAWEEKLNGACIYEFIADPSGKNIIQERAFDKNYNLLYAFSKIPVGSNKFIGSYKDINGLPAEMRNERGYKYGTLALITEDDYGYENRVEYIDAQGNNKPNADGAFAEIYEYDRTGNLKMQYSVDSLGNNVKDNWGNCALIHDYRKNHTLKSTMCTDETLSPMRMPSPESGDKTGTIKILFTYDKFLRLETQVFVNDKNEKDINAYGCHKIVHEYDRFGNMISAVGYDAEGKLAAMDASGTAKSLFRYDDNGNISEILFLDKYDNPVATDGYMFKIDYEYDGKDDLVMEKRWTKKAGKDKILTLYEIRDYPEYNEEKTTWPYGLTRVVRKDKRNREILDAYYNEDGSPALNNEKTWSYKITQYSDKKNMSESISSFCDVDGNLSQSGSLEFNRAITVRDSISKREFYKNFKNDELVHTFSKKFNDDFSKAIEQSDNNAFGKIARAGGASGVRFYNAKVKWTPFNDVSYIVCEDEFGEPDYLSAADGTICYYRRTTSQGSLSMSVENEVVDAFDNLKMQNILPKVMSVEVIDSVAYNMGLRDNDVILIYGDYSVNLEEIPSLDNFRKDWAIASVLESNKPSRMVVFRVEDGKNNKYGLVGINNLKGRLSELGIIAHIRYLTERQKNRILSSIEADMASANPVVTSDDFEITASDADNYVVYSFPEMYRPYREKRYTKNVIDPAILLGASVREDDLYWTLEDGSNTKAFEDMLTSRGRQKLSYPVMDIYVTPDLKEIKHLSFSEQGINARWFDAKVSDETYTALLNLYSKCSAEIKHVRSESSPFKANDFIACWQAPEADDGLKSGMAAGHLRLMKDGTCEGRLYDDGEIAFVSGTARFRIGRDYSGTWTLSDSLILVEPLSEDNVTLTCVDVAGANDGYKDRVLAYMNSSACKTNKESLLTRMEYFGTPWGKVLSVRSINKDSMIVDKGAEQPMAFSKIKEKEFNTLKKSAQEPYISKWANKSGIKNPASEFVGCWESEYLGMPGSSAILVLNDDNSMSMTMKVVNKQEMSRTVTITGIIEVKFGGEWSYLDGIMKFTGNPSLMEINVDVDVSAETEEEKAAFKPMLLKQLISQKEDYAMNMLQNNAFDSEIVISEITDSTFVMGMGYGKWTWRRK